MERSFQCLLDKQWAPFNQASLKSTQLFKIKESIHKLKIKPTDKIEGRMLSPQDLTPLLKTMEETRTRLDYQEQTQAEVSMQP